MTQDLRPRTEGRRLKTEGRRLKKEGRRLKSRQKAEDSRKKAEDSRQKARLKTVFLLCFNTKYMRLEPLKTINVQDELAASVARMPNLIKILSISHQLHIIQ
jgi:hypothetical protein